jgi:hypothetical protein
MSRNAVEIGERTARSNISSKRRRRLSIESSLSGDLEFFFAMFSLRREQDASMVHSIKLPSSGVDIASSAKRAFTFYVVATDEYLLFSPDP